MSKPKLEWAEKGEDEDFDAAEKYLSLLCSDTKAAALIRSLRNSKLVKHAANDLLRAADLPLLPSEEAHVSDDLKRIQKGKALPPVLLVRGDMAAGLRLIVADGYHRICAVCYFDDNPSDGMTETRALARLYLSDAVRFWRGWRLLGTVRRR